MNEQTEQRELPRYRCHKEVWALKIKSIQIPARADDAEYDGSTLLTFEDAGYAPIAVDWQYNSKHAPKVGGYYVVYADGYKSFSPAKAFEDGYTRI